MPFVGLALLARPRYRLGLSQRLGFLPEEVKQRVHGRQPLWLHAPSVGEVLAAQPFLRALKQAFPDEPLLLSVQTPTAYATVHTKLTEADAVMYFPLDHPLLIWRVLRQVRPAAFFFTETEMWPNCLSALARAGVPTFLVSGRFSRRARARYRLLRPFFRPIFQNLTLCCMQTRDDAERLIEAGTPRGRVMVTGNFKMDGVNAGGDQGQGLLQVAGLANRLLLVGASTHPGEEAVLLHVYRRLCTTVPNLLLLLAPRHPQRFSEVEEMLKLGGYRYVKRSQLTGAPSAHPHRLPQHPAAADEVGPGHAGRGAGRGHPRGRPLHVRRHRSPDAHPVSGRRARRRLRPVPPDAPLDGGGRPAGHRRHPEGRALSRRLGEDRAREPLPAHGRHRHRPERRDASPRGKPR